MDPSGHEKTLLAVKGLCLTYPGADRPALDSVSFAVKEGEIFGLLGPNGAGKTSVVSLLSTWLSPTAGSAAVCGADTVLDGAKARACIGVVPQEVALYPTLTAAENLAFFGGIHGLSGENLSTRIGQALDLVGLAERGSERMDTFSGGMRRRLNLAAGILHNPKVLFLDEPTTGVDPQSRRRILDNVRALAQKGTAILYTTHYMEEAENLCHRLAILDEGRIIAQGSPQELIEAHGEDADRVRTATLEEVFLTLTGRRLRDG
jgi:ABC-2 type transport system ATP-binding protein